MKIFNEEPAHGKKPHEFVLIVDSKEALALMDIIATACKLSPRKSAWNKIKEALEERLTCY